MEKALDAGQQTVPSGCLQEAVERKGWQQHLHSPALPRLTCKEVQRAGVPAFLVSEELQGREKILSGLTLVCTATPLLCQALAWTIRCHCSLNCPVH